VRVVLGEFLEELLLGQEASLSISYHGDAEDDVFLQPFIAEEVEYAGEFF
jgi:hypothetical protein